MNQTTHAPIPVAELGKEHPKFALPTHKEVEPKYKDIRGRVIIRANGTKMTKVNGGYTPETAEEEELCKYFEKLGYLQLVK